MIDEERINRIRAMVDKAAVGMARSATDYPPLYQDFFVVADVAFLLGVIDNLRAELRKSVSRGGWGRGW